MSNFETLFLNNAPLGITQPNSEVASFIHINYVVSLLSTGYSINKRQRIKVAIILSWIVVETFDSDSS